MPVYKLVYQDVLDATTLPWYKAFEQNYQDSKFHEMEFSQNDKIGFVLCAEKKIVEYCDNHEERIKVLEKENAQLREEIETINDRLKALEQ